jgi:hypothetical protein
MTDHVDDAADVDAAGGPRSAVPVLDSNLHAHHTRTRTRAAAHRKQLIVFNALDG